MIVVDSGCTYFVTPHRHYFIPGTLRPTQHTMSGVDGTATGILLEGIVSFVVKDPHNLTLYRITVPALLSSTGNTLLSVKQLREQDGIGYHVPTSASPSFLFTGNLHNPVDKLLLDSGFNGLDLLTPLTESELNDLIQNQNHTLRDLTSSPTDVKLGKTRCTEILHYQTGLICTPSTDSLTPQQALLNTHDQPPPSDRPKTSSVSSSSHVPTSAPSIRRVRRQAAAAVGNSVSAEDLALLRRYLPNKTKQAIRLQAMGGYGNIRTTRRFLQNTVGHGLSSSDLGFLPYNMINQQANMLPPRPQKYRNHRNQLKAQTPLTLQQRHDLAAANKPWIKAAPLNTKDPRTQYDKFESWAIDTIEYPVRGLQDIKYALTCVEVHTKLTYCFFMRRKSDAPAAMRALRNRVHQEHSATLKHLYCDGAKEYHSTAVQNWLTRNKIKQTVTSPYVHWLNGRVERLNQEYRRITRSLLKSAHHPNFMWPAAHAYAQHILNARQAAGPDNKSPYELAFDEKLDITNWQPYGTPCMVKLTETANTKQLDDRGTLGIYLGPVHNNPLITVESPYSHAVLTSPGRMSRIAYTGMISFDHDFDLEAHVQDKFFCGSSDSATNNGTIESSYVPSDFWNSIPTDIAKQPSQLSKSIADADSVSIHDDIPVGQPLAQSTVHHDASSHAAPPSSSPSPRKQPAKKTTKGKPQKNKAPKVVFTKIPMTIINRLIANSVPLRYDQSNPKRGDSHDRYELYKHASTTSEFIDLNPETTGKAKADLQFDLSRRYVTLLDPAYASIISQHLNEVSAAQHQAEHHGLLLQPICVAGRHPMHPVVDKNVIYHSDDAFTISLDMKELDSVEPHLRQPMYNAMIDEMKSILSMQTFRWASMPSNSKPISTRMVLKTKLHADGSFDKYKARLCCRGFLQRENVHYFQTFTPTSDLTVFRALLIEAALNKWHVKHADIKNAFCSAAIDVDNLFITMPNGITVHDPNPNPNSDRRGLLLQKALYGLKQSPRLFWLDVKKLLTSNKLTSMTRDSTAFTYVDAQGVTTYVLVYVDDIVIVGPSEAGCDHVRDGSKATRT